MLDSEDIYYQMSEFEDPPCIMIDCYIRHIVHVNVLPETNLLCRRDWNGSWTGGLIKYLPLVLTTAQTQLLLNLQSQSSY